NLKLMALKQIIWLQLRILIMVVLNLPWLTSAQVTLVSLGHSTNNFGGEAFSIAIKGNYAYIANDVDGLRIFDISNPLKPDGVGPSVTNFGDIALGVAVSGNYAFVANDADGLRIFDVSSPANPVNVGYASDADNTGYALDVTVSGNFAYVANGGDGLRIYDVTN